MRLMRLLWIPLLLAVFAVPPAAGGGSPVPGFRQVETGPKGGAIWSGRIPNSVFPSDSRASALYLPPGYSATKRYPVIYLLHGFPGSPIGFYHSLQLAQVADGLIASKRAAPFIAVMPVAGRPVGDQRLDEWTGAWEDHVVRDVVPWTEANLPVRRAASARVLAGLSAGAYGAVDIGLRHPGMFGTLESWGGYFHPFKNGSLRHASKRELDAHDPTLLVRRNASLLRRNGVRFFLSTGFTHAGVARSWTTDFARELQGFGIPYGLWLSKHPDAGKYLLKQLPAALAYAAPPQG